MTSPRPSPIGEGVKKGKTQIISVGSISKGVNYFFLA